MQAGRLQNWHSAIENPQPLARMLCIIAAAALIGVELWPILQSQFGKPETNRTHPAAQTARNPADIEQIIAADLFGHAATQNTNFPQTDLQVTLRAVFAANDPKAASAVVETGDGRAQVVKIGGAIGSAATLQEVYPNRIVLSRNGVLETLYFPVPDSTTTAIAQNTSAPETITPADGNPPPGASAEEIKRAAILQRLEELRARTSR